MAKRSMRRRVMKSMKRTMRKMRRSKAKKRSTKRNKKQDKSVMDSWNVSSSKYIPVKSKKKKSKSGKRPLQAWNNHLMAVYKSMKAKDSSVKFGDAMKAARKTYNKQSGGGDKTYTRRRRGGGKTYTRRRR